MRKILLPLIAVPIFLTGCGAFQKTIGLKDDPAYSESKTTSIYGDWVLDTPTDSTAFAGASQVEMQLTSGTFVIMAMYPDQQNVVIRGSALRTDSSSALTLTPQSGSARAGSRGALLMAVGQPVTLLASAAGNTLIFSGVNAVSSADVSSVWHKKAAAKAAGTLTTPDSARRTP